MGDTKDEAEWRTEFERFGEEQVRSSLASGLFHEPKRQFAFRWLGDEALARRDREKKTYNDVRGTLFWGWIGGVAGIIAAAGALIAAWPVIKGWLG
jgi:hypothetical protein